MQPSNNNTNLSPEALSSIMSMLSQSGLNLNNLNLSSGSLNMSTLLASLPQLSQLSAAQQQQKPNPSANNSKPKIDLNNNGNKTTAGFMGNKTTPTGGSNTRPQQQTTFFNKSMNSGNTEEEHKSRPQGQGRSFPMNNNMGNMNRGEQPTVTVLMVAEKPSIAKTIAEAFSNGRSRSRKGVSKFCQVHEFIGDMFGQKVQFKVTSVTGHIYIADFTPEYQDWRLVNPASLFEATTIKKETNAESRIIEHLKTEAQDASYLLLWLDNDREGENICYEILDNVKDCLRKESFEQVYRVRFSSLVKEDLLAAFENISTGPNYNESRAVDARQIIDLKIGVAFTRFQTRYLMKRYADLNTKMVTFGPCQTPTLGFCVERDDEIKSFKSQQFFKIVPTVMHTSTGAKHELTWTNERTLVIEEVQRVKMELDMARELSVVESSNKDATRGRPEALNTPQMLKSSSSMLGMGPQQTMQIAEKLYQQGYITYPRTESTSYPDKFNFAGTLEELAGIQNFTNYCHKLIENSERPKKGKDVGDHPPITPTLKAPHRGNLTQEEWKLYEYVARHFLATISPDAKMTNSVVVFASGQHRFQLKGTRILSPGFTEITPWVKVYGNEIPEFVEGQRYAMVSCEVKAGKTTPPDHLTESDVINLMEKHGIGTDASMAQHINNICERNYVQVTGNTRKLVPTKLGSALVHSYKEIDPDLVAADLRSQIEQRVDMIAKGEADYDEVLNTILQLFSEKFQNFRTSISVMDNHFTQNFENYETALTHAEPFSICGQCSQPMLFVSKFNKMKCDTCNLQLTLPMNGDVVIAGEHFCPLDNFQLLLFTSHNKVTSYTICPMCSNHAQYPEVPGKITCNLCPQADCVYSAVNNQIKECDTCKKGALVIDQMIANTLTASCNYCTHKLILAENVSQFMRSSDQCSSCKAYKLTELALQESGDSHKDVCIFCDPILSGSIQVIESATEEKKQNAFMQNQMERNQGGDGNGNFRNNYNERRGGFNSERRGGFHNRGGDRNNFRGGDRNNFRGNSRGGFRGGFRGGNRDRSQGDRGDFGGNNRERSFENGGNNRERSFENGGNNRERSFENEENRPPRSFNDGSIQQGSKKIQKFNNFNRDGGNQGDFQQRKFQNFNGQSGNRFNNNNNNNRQQPFNKNGPRFNNNNNRDGGNFNNNRDGGNGGGNFNNRNQGQQGQGQGQGQGQQGNNFRPQQQERTLMSYDI